MTVVISGSNGITNVNGSAGSPAETGTTSTNTGMWFPAANTVAWSTNGTEAMRLNASGGLSLGSTSDAGAGNFYATGEIDWGGTGPGASSLGFLSYTGGNSAIGSRGATALTFYTNGSERMRIDSSGNVGIGTSSPSYKLQVSGTQNNNDIVITDTTISSSLRMQMIDAYGAVFTTGSYPLMFGTNATERMRIDSSGNLMVATTTNFDTARLLSKGTSTSGAAAFYIPTATAGNGVTAWYSDNHGASSVAAYMRGDGGLANYSGNNVNLSDERTKTNIQDASGYLAKICAIPVRTFKYKDVENGKTNLGVIAQEVEKVAPELVDASGFGETPSDGVPLKAIYQTDLQYALMKCIQEQQAIINDLQAKLKSAGIAGF